MLHNKLYFSMALITLRNVIQYDLNNFVLLQALWFYMIHQNATYSIVHLK